ncbi:helix-turn-helix transcriptional regulator [Arthrobacter sp. PO-11]|uniref:Helix-turn-helix transcriptional regulator n=2 Tax=Arthrobacter cavernae TaxID=2817681 RepID=A0A939H925_9MICC|nr:helix-turn-helix transcriptional regulator [Arthrobacter cavernae]
MHSWGDASVALDPVETGHVKPGNHLKWSVAARGSELERVKAALTAPDCLGVIITGAHGVGKTSMSHLVVASLDEAPHVLHLRTPTTDNASAYGAFGFMLARLPQKYLGSPTGILQGITAMLRQDAGGRDVVIVVDNPVGMDDMSTGVLMNILITGTARIIAIAPHVGDLPADFHWLVQDGRLSEVTLETLTQQQTGELLSAMLGHRLTKALTSNLHAMTGGNPLLLESIVTEQRQRGNLVLVNSVWTLRGDVVLEGGHGLEEIVRSRWSRETREAKEVIEMLACARRVPLAVLASVYNAKTLADMEESGLLRVDDCAERWISLRLQYMSDIVRGWLTVPRRRKLREKLLEHNEPALADMTAEDLMVYAAWAHDCQVELDPAHALAAARASVRLFDPVFAIKCAESIRRSDAEWAGGQREKAAAYILLSDSKQALAAVEDVSDEQLDALPINELAAYTGVRCAAMRGVAGQSGLVPHVLDAARERLERLGKDTESEEHGRAVRRLDLEEFVHAAHTGEYMRVMERLEMAAADCTVPHLSHSIHSSIILIEAYAMTGREMDALRLSEATAQRIAEAPSPGAFWEHYRLRAFCATLAAGHWRSCLRILASGPAATPSELQYRGAVLELAIGMAKLFAGRGPEALESLLPAAAQLEHRPVMNLLPLAYAATAFAYAQIGDSTNAYKYLSLEGADGWAGGFVTNWAREFCTNMARRWLGEPDARERLVSAAKEDIAQQRYAVAGINLVGATVNGRDEDFLLMEQVAARRQGSLARMSSLMAKGSLGHSSRLMMEAADLAARLELDAMEARCVALALDYARLASDQTTSRLAQARLDRLSELVVELPVVPQGNAPLLTERERQIARLAGRGVSNRDIARDIGVSVRTVEGHLYQVFAKLSVSSRRDLLGLI